MGGTTAMGHAKWCSGDERCLGWGWSGFDRSQAQTLTSCVPFLLTSRAVLTIYIISPQIRVLGAGIKPGNLGECALQWTRRIPLVSPIAAVLPIAAGQQSHHPQHHAARRFRGFTAQKRSLHPPQLHIDPCYSARKFQAHKGNGPLIRVSNLVQPLAAPGVRQGD